ncbi:MAG: nucleotidyltransferase domain-containing protein [Candidatus Taylorbacteria bacterium]|nr:nucleotidyltransferase domain-containing protein [Candidatus Taylorbacteria bacterium]
MNEDQLEKLTPLFDSFPEVKLVYFFGSKSNGNGGPLSDYDFAVYLAESDRKKRFDLKLNLMTELSRALGTDAVDVVIFNDTESPELKYGIIHEGRVIYEKEPYRVLVEPRILNDYFDFIYGLRKYGLTKI